MGELDIAAKALLREEPEAVVRLALGDVRVLSVAADESELPARAQRLDKLLRIETADEPEPIWLHVEVQAAWTSDVPRRVFDYWTLAHRLHERVGSFVLCLKPGDKQGRPRGVYDAHFRGRRVQRFRFEVLCAWHLQAAELLVRGVPGLQPLVPFAADATPERVDAAMQALAAVQPRRRRAELQAALAAFAGNVYPHTRWLERIPREILMESTVYQEIKAEGRTEGQRELVALLLERRLGAGAEPFVGRLALCTQALLAQAAEALAGGSSDADLVKTLDSLLPRPESGEVEQRHRAP